MNKILAIIFVILLGLTYKLASAEEALYCPPPSYDAGGFCKTVTGCPYGDSIPLDSPKCAPPPEPIAPAAEPLEPLQYEGGGK